MAIIITQGNQRKDWQIIAFISVIAIAIILGLYFLFFSSAPMIENLVSSTSQNIVSDISKINEDEFKKAISVTAKELSTKIRQKVTASSSGGSTSGSGGSGMGNVTPGRANPFLPY